MPLTYDPGHLVSAYDSPVGHLIVDDHGRYRAYGLDWTPIGVYTTARRALHAFDIAALYSVYGTTIEALLAELRQHGLLCLGDETNLNRLERCTESQIREIATELLDRRWSNQDVSQLVATWRNMRGTA